MRERKNTADAGRDVGSIVTAAVNMVKLPNQFKLEASVVNDFTPYLHYS
jgi:hypothetical protein